MKVRGGEFSTGTTGNFQPELTLEPFAKSSVGKLALPDEFPDGPNRAAKIVCGFG